TVRWPAAVGGGFARRGDLRGRCASNGAATSVASASASSACPVLIALSPPRPVPASFPTLRQFVQLDPPVLRAPLCGGIRRDGSRSAIAARLQARRTHAPA